jgi:hypothetical protein
VSSAKHTPTGDASFRSSLLRNGAGALGLVVLVALVFWGIGNIGGPSGTPTASDAPGTDADDDADAGEEPEDPPEPDPTEDPEADEDDGDDADATDDDATEADADDDGDADDGEADDGDADDGDTGGAATERAVPPGEVTIQVLDGFKEDGGTAADGVASLLQDAGYDVIARNDALSYEVTTVLYNPGNEAAAQQVAADLGGAEVREQPGNLSTAVSLHVVVGRDRG